MSDVREFIASAGPRGTFASTATIARRLGVSRRTVFRRLAELKREGTIIVETRERPNGSRSSSIRRMADPELCTRRRPRFARPCHSPTGVLTYPSDRGEGSSPYASTPTRRVVVAYSVAYRKHHNGSYPPHRRRSALARHAKRLLGRGFDVEDVLKIAVRIGELGVDGRELSAWVDPPKTVAYVEPRKTEEERLRASSWSSRIAASLRASIVPEAAR